MINPSSSIGAKDGCDPDLACSAHQSIARGPAIVVGASCRALAESLVNAGYQVFALDLFADRDLKEIATCFPITDFNDLSQLGLLPPTASLFFGGGCEHLAPLVTSLAQRYELLGPTCEQIEALRNRTHWERWAFRAGIEFPRSIDELNCSDDIANKFSSRWLAKPRKGAGGIGIVEIDRMEVGPFRNSMPDHFLQEWIPGIPISAIFLANGRDVEVLCGFEALRPQDWDGPTPYLYRGSIGPVGFSIEIQLALKRFAQAVFADVPWHGWIQADFILQETTEQQHRLWLLEINPRWSASMELWERTTQVSLIASWLKQESNSASLNLGNPLPVESTNREHRQDMRDVIVKGILYADRDLCLSTSISDQLMNFRRGAIGPHADRWIADIPSGPTLIPQDAPVLSLFARDSSRETAIAALHRWKEEVHSFLSR